MAAVARLPAILAALFGCCAAAAEPQTGPSTEKRFPPLVVPAGFQATLFACDPLIEYPSTIALGPPERPRSLLVAIDYMTGLGTEIVRRDEIRLIEDTDADGYADRATVYADGFNSIMGLTFHGGTVYVMHSPHLTALRDIDGDGKADERRDLLAGLGLPPEQNDVRLHCANGIVMGHDGWLYLALGDHGCDVPRPEGDRLVQHGGGILRCRPDGRDLHLFAAGLRNIYDVALDDQLNVFVRDNENDGGDYKIRVCYSFHSADHGYPYHYYEHPDEAMPPLADLGLGSSAGGAAYLERQFPAEYRGSLFFCEWGRAVVRYHPQRDAAGFAPLPEMPFAAGAENDPYGFKPTDVVVDRDGSLLVSDWCDGQRPKRGRGRIYRITHRGADVQPAKKNPGSGEAPAARSAETLLARLDSDNYYERMEAQQALAGRGAEGLKLVREALAGSDRLGVHGRMHAAWMLASDTGPAARQQLLSLVKSDPDWRVQVQAIRALADMSDPVLVLDRLDAGRGDNAIAVELAALADGKDPRVICELVVAVGRLQWSGTPDWLREVLAAQPKLDPVLAHASMQALRHCADWPAVLRLLDLPDEAAIRPIALRSLANQADAVVVDGLIARLDDKNPRRRREYADLLTRVCRRPGAWEYWGYRPPPRPPNRTAWERTEAIERALDGMLADADRDIRRAVLTRMQRENIPAQLETLAAWLAHERSEGAVAAILQSLPREPADEVHKVLRTVVLDREHAAANRLTALGSIDGNLLNLAAALEDGPVLAELLRRFGRARDANAARLLTGKLDAASPAVRAAAAEALAAIGATEAGEAIVPLLDDKEAQVRRSAAEAVAKLKLRSATEPLLRLASDRDAEVRRASLEALRAFHERRAVPAAAAALADRDAQMAALKLIVELGGIEHADAVIELAKRDPADAVVSLAIKGLSDWTGRDGVAASRRSELARAVRDIQGTSGVFARWQVAGPLAAGAIEASRVRLLANNAAKPLSDESAWRTLLAEGASSQVALKSNSAAAGSAWLAFTDFELSEAANVQFLASASGDFQVWLNGKSIHRRSEARPFQPDSDRFDALLAEGTNRLVVQVTPEAAEAQFHVRFRRKSSTAEIERLVQAALTRTGDSERGRKLFLDAQKTQCVKCHRIGDAGERIGPELTGLGDRFSRIHVIESILEPSRTVTPGFQTVVVRLDDGQSLSGIRISENDTTITLADQKGEKHELAKASIEERALQPRSTMPDNLVQQLSIDQFVDLVTFLAAQKQPPAEAPR